VIELPNLTISLGMLDMQHIIYVWDLFFNMNSTVMFVFVIVLLYLAILANVIIGVSKTTSAYNI
jgi:hypothetical protein